MIRRMQIAIALAASVFAASAVNAQTYGSSTYSRGELKTMAHDAHTPEQYEALASYYRFRQQVFEQRAQSEMAEWIRRSQFVFATANKYPRPVDSSRNRYEYFAYESRQMSQLADRYERLSATVAH